jgi:hypothetical protein
LVGKPEENNSHGRRRKRWEANIKCIFKNRVGGVEFIDMAEDRNEFHGLVNMQ